MNPFAVAIVAIIAWAIVQMSRNKTRGGGPFDPALLADLTARLDAAEAERTRLTERVQNLEAIVTTETFDLARTNPEAAEARLELPDEPEAVETPEEEAARLARRMRS